MEQPTCCGLQAEAPVAAGCLSPGNPTAGKHPLCSNIGILDDSLARGWVWIGLDWIGLDCGLDCGLDWIELESIPFPWIRCFRRGGAATRGTGMYLRIATRPPGPPVPGNNRIHHRRRHGTRGQLRRPRCSVPPRSRSDIPRRSRCRRLQRRPSLRFLPVVPVSCGISSAAAVDGGGCSESGPFRRPRTKGTIPWRFRCARRCRPRRSRRRRRRRHHHHRHPGRLSRTTTAAAAMAPGRVDLPIVASTAASPRAQRWQRQQR